MSIIDRYLFRNVVTTAGVVLLVVLALELFFISLRELEDVGEGDYGIGGVSIFLLLSLPRLVYETLPLALLVGGLLGVGGLAASNELVAMRATGMSLLRLTFSVLAAGLVLGGLALALGEFVAPVSDRAAKQFRAQAQTRGSTLPSAGGFWARDGRQFIRVGTVLSDGTLADVEIFRLADHGRLEAVVHAKSGRYQDGSWQLTEVAESAIAFDGVTTRRLPTLVWQSSMRPETLDLLAAEPTELGLRELGGYISYLRDNGLDAREYQLAYWVKCFAPLTNLAMLAIGLPFAFSRQRSAGAGQRLLIGVVLGLGFFLFNRMLGSWVLLSGMPPLVGALAPPALFLISGLLPLTKMR